MIGRLLAEESRRLRRDTAFLAACVLLAILAGYAVASGQLWLTERWLAYQTQSETADLTLRREAEAIVALERGEIPLSAAPSAGLPHLAKHEFMLPPLATAGLALGEAELRPTHATIGATTRAHEMFRFQEVDNPILLGWGRFDLAFLIIVLWPLFILGFGCNTLSIDRDNGTLRLLLSQPITARRLAIIRVALRSAALLVALGIGAGLSGLIFLSPTWVQPPPTPNLDPEPWRLAMFTISVLVYGFFWSSLALWLVARNQSSEQNALTMVLWWMLFVLILPAITGLAVKLSNPLPSRLAYITEARNAENIANQQGRALLENYLLDHPELEATRGDAVAPFIKTFVLVQQRVSDAVAPIVQTFADTEQRQQRVADALRWVSPRELAERNLLLASGNDSRRFADFEQQARVLRANWLASLEEPLIAGRRLTSDEFRALPRATFRETGSFVDTQRMLSQLGILLGFAWLLFAAAWYRLRAFSPVTEQTD